MGCKSRRDVTDGILWWWFFFKYFHTQQTVCLIRDLPEVWELWGKRDHIRGSEAVFSSILSTRYLISEYSF